MKKHNKKSVIKGILVITIILLANLINISYLSFAQTSVTNFGCDAEQIGPKRYKTDVYQVINFIYVFI